MAVEPKPSHLGPAYAGQFQDQSVAAAYAARPPYPPELFDILESLMPNRPRRVLELGCGTGDLTLELAQRVDTLDAVDFSSAMLAKARSKSGAEHSSLRWHEMAAESFTAAEPFDLICAGASLHWMDWPVLFPRLDALLIEGGFLAIVDRFVKKRPWDQSVFDLIPTYSTNREFEPYDLVAELTSRGFFVESGRKKTAPVPFSQIMDAYVESFHSSNGFSRQRMTPQKAAEFDAKVREIAAPWCPEDTVRGEVVGRVIWGRPSAALR